MCVIWSSNICVCCVMCVCETDIPMSVGIVEPKTHSSQLNAAEFLWDMNKRTSVFVQVTHTFILTHTNHTRTHTHTHLLSFVPPVGRATEFPHQTHILITLVLLFPPLSAGALHQHRVHSQETRWREGRPLQDPV